MGYPKNLHAGPKKKKTWRKNASTTLATRYNNHLYNNVLDNNELYASLIVKHIYEKEPQYDGSFLVLWTRAISQNQSHYTKANQQWFP